MAPEKSWKAHLLRNTATNYLRTGVRFATGFLVFRMLFQHFSDEELGFWSLLWSVFGYTVLLDFGMGYTAYREVAVGVATRDWERMNRLMSTMFWSFVALGLFVVTLCLGGHDLFLRAIKVSPENYESFSDAYWIFFGALAIAFPVGLFSEMLAGLQRLDLANWTAMVGALVNLGTVYLGIHYHWPFEVFVLAGVGTALIPTFSAYFIVRRLMPELSLHPKLYHFGSVREMMSFSLSVYVITLTNIIIAQTHHLIISVCLNVAAVAVFQAGNKVVEMFGIFTQQMQNALDAAAAHLRATGDSTTLRRLLLRSTRLVTLLCTPAYALAASHFEHLVRLVTGLKVVPHAALEVGQLLLATSFSSLLVSSCAKPVLIMIGWEKPMLRLSLFNAIGSLGLSVVLVLKLGVIGVGIGALVAGVLTGWIGFLPLTLKFVEMSLFDWLREVFWSVSPPIALSLGTLAALLWFWPLPPSSSFGWVILRGAVVIAPPLVAAWKSRKELV